MRCNTTINFPCLPHDSTLWWIITLQLILHYTYTFYCSFPLSHSAFYFAAWVLRAPWASGKSCWKPPYDAYWSIGKCPGSTFSIASFLAFSLVFIRVSACYCLLKCICARRTAQPCTHSSGTSSGAERPRASGGGRVRSSRWNEEEEGRNAK